MPRDALTRASAKALLWAKLSNSPRDTRGPPGTRRSGAVTVDRFVPPRREEKRRGRPQAAPGIDQTQPVGFGRPATLQAPFAGPDGNSS